MIKAECHHDKVDTGPAPSTFASKKVVWKSKKSKSSAFKNWHILKREVMNLELQAEAATHVNSFLDNCGQHVHLYVSKLCYSNW